MNLFFRNKRISSILTVLPKRISYFDDEMEKFNFSKSQSNKLKSIMGYNKHRIIDNQTCSSDLCIYGINKLKEENIINFDEIDALVVITQSPDYFMPPTSSIIHGALNLKKDMICIDINQGCAGYIIGLIEAFMLLDQPLINKVALCNVDILSKKVSSQDRNSYPLIGDGAAITIVERATENNKIFGVIKVDGSRADLLMIPAGGFKKPSSSETAIIIEDDKDNFRAEDHLVMKGDLVFNFVQTEVPPMLEDLLSYANISKEDIDYYMFHQPNRFMLQKLAQSINVPELKMPNNIVENFGNASGVTIPTAICYNLGNQLLSENFTMCLAGFGVGLTWAGLIMDIGNLNYCNISEYDI